MSCVIFIIIELNCTGVMKIKMVHGNLFYELVFIFHISASLEKVKIWET